MINTRNTVNNTNNVNTQKVELTSSAAMLSKRCRRLTHRGVNNMTVQELRDFLKDIPGEAEILHGIDSRGDILQAHVTMEYVEEVGEVRICVYNDEEGIKK